MSAPTEATTQNELTDAERRGLEALDALLMEQSERICELERQLRRKTLEV